MTDFIYWVLMVWLIAMYGFSAWHIWKLYGHLRKQNDRFEYYHSSILTLESKVRHLEARKDFANNANCSGAGKDGE